MVKCCWEKHENNALTSNQLKETKKLDDQVRSKNFPILLFDQNNRCIKLNSVLSFTNLIS